MIELFSRTSQAFDRLNQRLDHVQRDNPMALAWILQPRSLFFEWRRAQGDRLNVHTLTLGDACGRVLDQTGYGDLVLDDGQRRRVVSDVITEACADKKLAALARSAVTPGFPLHLDRWFQELREQGIDASQYRQYTEGAGHPREVELADLYQTYLTRLQHLDVLDEAGAMAAASRILETTQEAVSLPAFMGVLGYDAFHPLQARFLRALMAQGSECRIFLPISARRETINLAQATARRLEVEFPHLPAVQPQPSPSSMEAPDEEQEVRWVLRQVKRRLHDGVKCHDISLVVPSQAAYEPLLKAVADEYGIPLALPLRLGEHPLYITLRQLLSLHPDLEAQACWRVFGSPFFWQSCLEPEELQAIRCMTLQFRVIRGQSQWLAPLDAKLWKKGELERIGRLTELEFTSDTIASLRRGAEKLLAAVQPPVAEVNALAWVEDLLSPESGLPVGLVLPKDRLSPQDTLLAKRVRDEILRVVRDRKMEPLRTVNGEGESFADGLLSELERVEIPTFRPNDAVQVTTLRQSWMKPARRVFVMGMNEGRIPAVESPGPFHSHAERAKHPLPLRSHDFRTSRLWWDLLLANAPDETVLSRPLMQANARAAAPSPFWPDTEPEPRDGVASLLVPMPHEAASPAELALALLHQGADHPPEKLRDQWERSLAMARIAAVRASFAPQGVHEGVLRDSAILGELRDTFGADHVWSASELGDYARCPMGFMVKHVLKLEPWGEPEMGMDPRILGLWLHEILETAYRWLQTSGIPLSETRWPEIEAKLEWIVHRSWDGIFARYRFQPYPLGEVERDEVLSYAKWCMHNEMRHASGWHPKWLEWRFGLAGGEPVSVRMGGGNRIRLRGVVDRIDRKPDGSLRVVDYKSRKSVYAKREIENAVVNQAILYPLAVQESMGRVDESGYRMLLDTDQFKKSDLRHAHTFAGRVEDDGEAQRVLRVIRSHLKAIQSGAFPNAPNQVDEGSGGCAPWCELAAFCQPSHQSRWKARRGADA